MSKSYRKSPCFSVTCSGFNRGEKKDKQNAHRRLRSGAKQVCHLLCGAVDYELLDTACFPLLREISDVWDFAKDGKMHHWELCSSVKFLTWQKLERRKCLLRFLRK